MKKDERRIKTLEKQITMIKEKIFNIGDLRRGSLSEQYNVCGTPGCKCKASPQKKHGPYHQLSFTKNGKSRTKFVNRKDIKMVKVQVNNYTRLRKLISQWTELGTELSELKISKEEK